jgi:capsular exopolysaccharide synthesis family protein
MENLKLHHNPKSPLFEAFRTLRTNIQFTVIDKNIQTISVTSTKAAEGKSTVSRNLAYSIAGDGKKVLLIDGDLRRSRLHKIFNVSNDKGLTNVLIGDEKIEPQKIKDSESLYVLTSGVHPPNPSELLGSDKMKSYIEKLKEEYDTIIIDTPPVGLVTDGAIVSSFVDGTLFVCSSGETEIKAAQYTKQLLENVNANILGVVLNKVPFHKGGRYYYYDNSYYEDDVDEKSKTSVFNIFKKR